MTVQSAVLSFCLNMKRKLESFGESRTAQTVTQGLVMHFHLLQLGTLILRDFNNLNIVRARISILGQGVSRTLTLHYTCLFSFSVPVNFSLAFHNCKRNLIARSQNGDSSEIVRRHILLERRYWLFSGDVFLWFYTKESGIIT